MAIILLVLGQLQVSDQLKRFYEGYDVWIL